MKNYLTSLVIGFFLLLSGCSDKKASNTITFATSAEYPPFEYIEKGEIKGFDIDLGRLIADELGKTATFESMQFSAILPALQNNFADAAIATITITADRQKNFDFSKPYYTESMAMVFRKENPLQSPSQLPKRKVACQLGTTMEMWLKQHAHDTEIITMDNNNQAIEALKAKMVDGVLVDQMQGQIFSQKNSDLTFAQFGKSANGYGIAFKKNSVLKDQVNHALDILEAKGEIKKLEQKWLAK